MAVILTDENRTRFSTEINDLSSNITVLKTVLADAESALNDKVGKKFKQFYADGKKVTTKIEKVIDILQKQNTDLNKLVEDLREYVSTAETVK